MIRNVPLPFLMESTIHTIAVQEATRKNQQKARTAAVCLNPAHIEQYWNEIDQHKWFLGERLGRDVGMKVAAVDYFENVQRLGPARRNSFKKHFRAVSQRLLSVLDKALECDGPNSIANLERMMNGSR